MILWATLPIIVLPRHQSRFDRRFPLAKCISVIDLLLQVGYVFVNTGRDFTICLHASGVADYRRGCAVVAVKSH